MSDAPEKWHVERKIPLATIITAGSIVVTMIVWGSSLTGRVTTNEGKLAALASDHDRLVRIETQVDALREDAAEVKRLLRGSQFTRQASPLAVPTGARE